eukprot:CAMPEP_0169437958 /NCGR_PEP_ID=MMETSP1042-20121227/6405_1 /TAXON_ID=464988 /ORGANISM="Hemiselmis andersenii, Strain CCMP1180" /LENGTH=184 /DNA_ID=CAMNT_0009548765 /DNA_START=29 /DNA_END=579 /DNA_ORIENTATION=+
MTLNGTPLHRFSEGFCLPLRLYTAHKAPKRTQGPKEELMQSGYYNLFKSLQVFAQSKESAILTFLSGLGGGWWVVASLLGCGRHGRKPQALGVSGYVCHLFLGAPPLVLHHTQELLPRLPLPLFLSHRAGLPVRVPREGHAPLHLVRVLQSVVLDYLHDALPLYVLIREAALFQALLIQPVTLT